MSEAEAPQKDPRIGRVLLSQYRLDALLGEGGMGSVYRGVQLSVNRPVAIKLIAGKIAENPECVRRFRREAEAMAKLRHPNTVRLYEFGVADADTDHRELFMVMELLEGSDLSEQIMRRQRIPAGEALSIARQVLDALAEAHALGIVHRDLKPANVFLSQVHGGKWMAKVMDFGIAGIEQTEANTKLTMAGAVMGTPAYMSPEQAQGKGVDPRSDLYSLGVVLFEMLVGKPPFEADSAVSLLLAHVSTAPPKLRETSPDLHHAGIQQLLDALLHKKLDQRPASALAAIERIDQLLAQLGDPYSSSRYASLAANSAAPVDGSSNPLPTFLRSHARGRATTLGGPLRLGKGYWAAAVGIASLAAFLLWPRTETSAVEPSAPPPPKVDADKGAPPAPAAIATYSVQILSKPAGAGIELGGVEIGKTPYTLQFRRPTTLRVVLVGYIPKLLEVDPRSDPLLVVELDPVQLAKLKGTKRATNEHGAVSEPAVDAAPTAQAVKVPVAVPSTPTPAAPPVVPPALVAAAPIASPTPQRPPIVQANSLPPPAWVSQSSQQQKTAPLSARDRRQAMLQRGPTYPNVANAKRAYRSGQVSADVYEDNIWVLKTRRNDRIQAEKLNYKRGLIDRAEYDRRVKRIDFEYEGQ